MKVWMDVMRDLEHIMDDHERCLDTWQAGGVDGIVLGPMFFNAAKLLPGLKRPEGAPPSEAAASDACGTACRRRFTGPASFCSRKAPVGSTGTDADRSWMSYRG